MLLGTPNKILNVDRFTTDRADFVGLLRVDVFTDDHATEAFFHVALELLLEGLLSRVLDCALERHLLKVSAAEAVAGHVDDEALLVCAIVGVVAADGRTLLTETLHQATRETSTSEQDAGVGTVQVVVMQVLHHQQRLAVVLVRRHHDVVVQRLRHVLKRCHQQVRPDQRLIQAGIRQVKLIQSFHAKHLVESGLATCLLLRAVLVDDCVFINILEDVATSSAKWHTRHLLTDETSLKCLALRLHSSLLHLVHSLLTHEDQLAL